ncbi:LysM peptidoglycan-binding domain-containing protein [Alphaproteobacteria bacterium]|nr:LysM peptidoglycan-binding domain-containing protein [Alphaproteobacteria bacterium]
MKKEFLLLSALISSAIFAYLIYPISDLKQLDKQNVSEKNMVDKLQTNELIQNKDNIELTFDIVRLDKTGDVVIAGKTIPNIKVDILDGNEILASVFSDSNGDWVWISENPLPEGIKRFNLKHFDGEHEFFSHQNIIILREKNKYLSSKILKFSKSSSIEIINNNKKILGLSLDIAEYLNEDSLMLTGRTKPNAKVKLFFSDNFIKDSISDNRGVWKIELKNFEFTNNNLIVTTEIEGQKIKLKTKIFEKKIDPNFIFEKEVIVKNGNSLWRIARKTLGGGVYYSEIYKSNMKEIENPDLIFPGQVFNIPKLKK